MKYVEIKISQDEIQKELIKHFDPQKKNVSLICNTIITHLSNSDMGLEALYKALNGLEIYPKYKVGDKVWVKKHRVHYWRVSDEKCVAMGVMKGDNILVEITDIDLTKKNLYSIKYTYYVATDDNPVTEEIHSCVPEDDVMYHDDVMPFEGID